MLTGRHVAIAAFFAAAVLPRATWPLIDGDVWWHIRAGDEVLTTAHVPSVDTWSVVGLGHRWVSQDWLANVLMAALHRLGPWGDTSLSIVFGLVVVASFAILWSAIGLRSASAGWLGRIAWLSLGLVLAGLVMGVRVQVLDLLLTAAVIWLLWRYLVDPRGRWLLGLPLVAVAWANLHAGWLLLFLLGGAVIVGETTDRLLGRTDGRARPLTWPQLGALQAALIASALALAINPNGAALYSYPFDTLALGTLNRNVMEWFPATFDSVFGWLLAGFVVLAVLPTLAFARHRLRTADAIMLVGLTLMAYQAIRFLLILGPVAAAIAAVALSPILAATGFGRRLAPTLQRLAQPRRGLAMTNGALLVLVLVLGASVALLRSVPTAQAHEIRPRFPVAAVDWLAAKDPAGRILNQYEWGGYLGERIPNRRIFMDGRADVYGDDALRMYADLIGLDVPPESVLDRFQITHVLFATRAPLATWLDASKAWRVAYRDEVATVWVRTP